MIRGRRAVALVFLAVALIAAVGHFVAVGLPALTNSGSSDRGRITLVCGKCQRESDVPSAEFGTLPADPRTGCVRCPNCGGIEAALTSLRCPACRRAIPPQAAGPKLVCPFCTTPLGPQ